ncbi:hypothetical protein ACFWZ6_26160 [Streptomyces massasporeus]
MAVANGAAHVGQSGKSASMSLRSRSRKERRPAIEAAVPLANSTR